MTDAPQSSQQEATKLLTLAKAMFHGDGDKLTAAELNFQKEVDSYRSQAGNMDEVEGAMRASNSKINTLPSFTRTADRNGNLEWIFEPSALDLFSANNRHEIDVTKQDSDMIFVVRGDGYAQISSPLHHDSNRATLSGGAESYDPASAVRFADDGVAELAYKSTSKYPYANLPLDPPTHPESQKQLDISEALLSLAVRFSFGDDGSKPDFSAVKGYLENLTPVERMALAAKTMTDSLYSSTDKPTRDIDYCNVKSIQFDKQKDIQSITFAHRYYPQKEQDFTVTLDNKRANEGANTKEFHLPDGTLRSVSYADDGTPYQISDSDGTFLTRVLREGSKGDTWEISTAAGLEMSVQGNLPSGPMEDVSSINLLPDGSISIGHVHNDDRAASVTDVLKVDAKGDTILSTTDGNGQTSNVRFHDTVIKDRNNKELDQRIDISSPDWDPATKKKALDFAKLYDQDVNKGSEEITAMPPSQWAKWKPIVNAYLDTRRQ